MTRPEQHADAVGELEDERGERAEQPDVDDAEQRHREVRHRPDVVRGEEEPQKAEDDAQREDERDRALAPPVGRERKACARDDAEQRRRAVRHLLHRGVELGGGRGDDEGDQAHRRTRADREEHERDDCECDAHPDRDRQVAVS